MPENHEQSDYHEYTTQHTPPSPHSYESETFHNRDMHEFIDKMSGFF